MLSAAFLVLAALPVHAEMPSSALAWDGRQKFLFGKEGYRNTDTSLGVGLPLGFDVSADLNAYKTNTSSWTPTITLGAGWTHDQVSLGASYAITTLANDFRANAVDLSASAHTEPPDFRTTVGGDVLVTHNSVYLRFPVVTRQIEITQRAPTISIKQQVYGTRFDASFTEYTYNKDIVVAAAILTSPKLAAFSHFTGGLAGLVQGFPDHSERFGVRHVFDNFPLTLRGSYESLHFIDTTLQFHATADNFTYAADWDFLKVLTGSLEYNHVRETGQPSTDQYGFALSFSL